MIGALRGDMMSKDNNGNNFKELYVVFEGGREAVSDFIALFESEPNFKGIKEWIEVSYKEYLEGKQVENNFKMYKLRKYNIEKMCNDLKNKSKDEVGECIRVLESDNLEEIIKKLAVRILLSKKQDKYKDMLEYFYNGYSIDRIFKEIDKVLLSEIFVNSD